jgi:hypothetical protein
MGAQAQGRVKETVRPFPFAREWCIILGMKGRYDINWLLAPLLSVFAVGPLTRPGYFWGAHDARHSVYFLVEFDRAIRDGVLYPRWMPDFNSGFGYPFFNIYPPGAFYLGEAFHLLGLDFVTATKLVFGLGIILSGLTMYLFARRLWGRTGGLVAAVAYMYVPYRLVDVYVRGAQAESLVFAAFPLALWAFDGICRAPSWRGVAIAAMSVAAMMFCHYPLALFFLVVLGFYVLAQCGIRPGDRPWREWLRPFGHAGAAVVLGLGLSAVLLMPAILEYSGVRTDQWAGGYYDYRDHFVEPFQLLAPEWGFGTSVPGPDDAMPLQLGLVPVVLATLAVVWPGRKRGEADLEPGEETTPAVQRRTMIFLATGMVTATLLMLAVSAPVWDALRLASFAQFPWRLLTFTALFLALLCGALPGRLSPVNQAPGSNRTIAAAAPLLLVIILGSYPYLSPQIIDPPEGPVSLGGLMRFEQSANEMTGMTAWATAAKPPGWSPLADVFASGKNVTEKVVRQGLPEDARVTTTRHSSVLDEVVVNTPRAFTLRFYTAYYPGWQASLDGAPVPIAIWGDLGGMAVDVPAGEHRLELRFEDTWPRTAGQVISGISLLAVGALLFVHRRRGYRGVAFTTSCSRHPKEDSTGS